MLPLLAGLLGREALAMGVRAFAGKEGGSLVNSLGKLVSGGAAKGKAAGAPGVLAKLASAGGKGLSSLLAGKGSPDVATTTGDQQPSGSPPVAAQSGANAPAGIFAKLQAAIGSLAKPSGMMGAAVPPPPPLKSNAFAGLIVPPKPAATAGATPSSNAGQPAAPPLGSWRNLPPIPTNSGPSPSTLSHDSLGSLNKPPERAQSGPNQAGQPRGVTQHDVLHKGSNFGDILGGNKSTDDEQDKHKQEEAQKAKQAAEEKVTRNLKVMGLGLLAAGVAANKIPGALGAFGKSILSGQEYLRQFNGQINNAFARLQQQQIQLGFRSANATSGTTGALAEQQHAFNESSQEIKEVMQGVWNSVAIGATWLGRIGTVLIKWNPVFQAMKALVGQIEENTRKDTKLGDWPQFISDLADGAYSGLERDRKTKRAPGPMPQPAPKAKPRGIDAMPRFVDPAL